MTRRAGFTLIEICLAVSIVLLLVFVAMPSVAGALKEQRLQRTYETFDALVRKAQARSVNERRTYALVWKKQSIDLIARDRKEGEAPETPETIAVGEGEDYAIDRTAALLKKSDPIWTFWRSGVCEPAVISYKGPLGTWTVRYDPLTAHGAFLNEEVN